MMYGEYSTRKRITSKRSMFNGLDIEIFISVVIIQIKPMLLQSYVNGGGHKEKDGILIKTAESRRDSCEWCIA